MLKNSPEGTSIYNNTGTPIHPMSPLAKIAWMQQRTEGCSHPKGPLSDACVDALMRFLSTSDNTLSSILATLNAPLTVFSDPLVDAATSGDDFSVADVRRRRMTVYVCIPPNRLADARVLLNLFFAQLINVGNQFSATREPSL